MLDYAPPPLEESTYAAAPTIPHSREAEEAVVGGVLIDPEAYYDAAEFIGSLDFYIARHKYIWQAFTALLERRTPVDMLTVSNELEQMGVLAEIGGPAYLTSLVNQVPSSLNVAHYAKIVRGYASRRKMIAAANEIAREAYNVNIGPDAALARAETAWQDVRRGSDSGRHTLHMPEILSRSYDRQEAISKLGRPPGISTGLIDLDKILHGLKKGKYYLVASPPGQGKTAFLLTIARNVVKYEGKTVAFFSIEMQESGDDDDPTSGGELSERLIGMEADVDTTAISDGRMDQGEMARYTNALEHMEGWKLVVNDDTSITPDGIYSQCLRIKETMGLDLVIIDYIQITQTPDGMRFSNRAEEVAYLSKRMKLLSKNLNVAVMVAAQVNRAYAARADKKLVNSDLKESGNLEADANCIIFLQPEDEYAKKPETREKLVEVSKHRGGKVGDCKLFFCASRTEFRNAAHRSAEPPPPWWA